MSDNESYYSMQVLKQKLPDVIVSGFPKIKRAVINIQEEINISKDAKKEDKYVLLSEGVGLKEVMSTKGVLPYVSRSNNVMEVLAVLGVEAGRQAIIDELQTTFASHAIEVDARHINLVADRMTNKGTILGIQRHGLKHMKDSVLLNASFEITADHLFNAAVQGCMDHVTGVSESIITGNQMSGGTGLFGILYDEGQRMEVEERKFFFDSLLG